MITLLFLFLEVGNSSHMTWPESVLSRIFFGLATCWVTNVWKTRLCIQLDFDLNSIATNNLVKNQLICRFSDELAKIRFHPHPNIQKQDIFSVWQCRKCTNCKRLPFFMNLNDRHVHKSHHHFRRKSNICPWVLLHLYCPSTCVVPPLVFKYPLMKAL